MQNQGQPPGSAAVGAFTFGLMMTGAGSWIGAIVCFLEFRDPLAAAAFGGVAAVSFGVGLFSIVGVGRRQ